MWQATAHAQPGKPIPLGDTGVAVTLTSHDRSFHVGDFWRFALRPIQPAIVYPARYLARAPAARRPTDLGLPAGRADLGRRARESVELYPAVLQPRRADRRTGRLLHGGRRTGGCRRRGLAASPPRRLRAPGTRSPSAWSRAPTRSRRRSSSGRNSMASRCRPAGEEVVLQAPRRPGDEFVLGLIAVQDATSVTIRGMELTPPHVRFSPAERSFSGMPTATMTSSGTSPASCTSRSASPCTTLPASPWRTAPSAIRIQARRIASAPGSSRPGRWRTSRSRDAPSSPPARRRRITGVAGDGPRTGIGRSVPRPGNGRTGRLDAPAELRIPSGAELRPRPRGDRAAAARRRDDRAVPVPGHDGASARHGPPRDTARQPEHGPQLLRRLLVRLARRPGAVRHVRPRSRRRRRCIPGGLREPWGRRAAGPDPRDRDRDRPGAARGPSGRPTARSPAGSALPTRHCWRSRAGRSATSTRSHRSRPNCRPRSMLSS